MQGACPIFLSQAAIEKSTNEKNNYNYNNYKNSFELPKYLNLKKSTMFGSLNIQTMQQVCQMPELIESAEK